MDELIQAALIRFGVGNPPDSDEKLTYRDVFNRPSQRVQEEELQQLTSPVDQLNEWPTLPPVS